MAPHRPHARSEPAWPRAVKHNTTQPFFSLFLYPCLAFKVLTYSTYHQQAKSNPEEEEKKLTSSSALLSSPSAMGSLFDNLPKKKRLIFPTMPPYKDDLPISQSQQQKDTHLIGLRKRISSSFTVKIQPLSLPRVEWALRSSKSLPSLAGGGPVRRWWNWGWDWILSTKPPCAEDLEMNEEETVMLGSQSKGSWRHILYKLRSQIRKLMQPHAPCSADNTRII